MQEMKIYAPTYYGNAAPANGGTEREFDDPTVPVVVRSADGVRIVLGTLDYFDRGAPDVKIERRPNGWAIFLHPTGGGDPSGQVHFLDDGRSFVFPESNLCSTPPIREGDWDEAGAEIDKLKSS